MKGVYFSRIRSPCFYSHVIYGLGAFQFIREGPFLTPITCRFSPLLAVVFGGVPKFCLKVPKFCPSADDWSLALPAFSEQRVPDAHALRELSDYSFPRTKRLVVEYFLRLKISRFLHQWFPHWVTPFIFDLVLDHNLPYSQVLSLSQGWINKVKRSTM